MNTALVGHMAELVDAPVSGTGGSNTLEVRVFLCPPRFAKGFVWHTICLCGCKAMQAKENFGVVAQLIERYVRIVEVVGLSPISSTKVLGDMAEW